MSNLVQRAQQLILSLKILLKEAINIILTDFKALLFAIYFCKESYLIKHKSLNLNLEMLNLMKYHKSFHSLSNT